MKAMTARATAIAVVFGLQSVGGGRGYTVT